MNPEFHYIFHQFQVLLRPHPEPFRKPVHRPCHQTRSRHKLEAEHVHGGADDGLGDTHRLGKGHQGVRGINKNVAPQVCQEVVRELPVVTVCLPSSRGGWRRSPTS